MFCRMPVVPENPVLHVDPPVSLLDWKFSRQVQSQYRRPAFVIDKRSRLLVENEARAS